MMLYYFIGPSNLFNLFSMKRDFSQIFDIMKNLVANSPEYTSFHTSLTIFENTFVQWTYSSRVHFLESAGGHMVNSFNIYFSKSSVA